MTLQELFTRQAKQFIESIDLNEIIYNTQTISLLINRLGQLIGSDDSLNFLIVILDKDSKLKGVITSRQMDELLKKLKQVLESGEHPEKTLVVNIEKYFPPKEVIDLETGTVSQVYSLFESGSCDIVVVKDSAGKYVGKIKRNAFASSLKELLS